MRAPFLGLGDTAPNERSEIEGARLQALHDAQDGLCWYCTDPMMMLSGGKRRATTEHKQPVSRGGRSDPANLAAACEACNALKGDRTEAEFRAAYPRPDAVRTAHETSRERRKARRRARQARAALLRQTAEGRSGVTLAERLGLTRQTEEVPCSATTN